MSAQLSPLLNLLRNDYHALIFFFPMLWSHSCAGIVDVAMWMSCFLKSTHTFCGFQFVMCTFWKSPDSCDQCNAVCVLEFGWDTNPNSPNAALPYGPFTTGEQVQGMGRGTLQKKYTYVLWHSVCYVYFQQSLSPMGQWVLRTRATHAREAPFVGFIAMPPEQEPCKHRSTFIWVKVMTTNI